MENLNINNMPMPEGDNNSVSSKEGMRVEGAVKGVGGMPDDRAKAAMFIMSVVLAGIVVLIAIFFLSNKPSPTSDRDGIEPPPNGKLPLVPGLSQVPLSGGDSVNDIGSDLDSIELESFDSDFQELEQQINQL